MTTPRLASLTIWTTLLLAAPAYAGSITWHMSVDTSSLSATSGFLDFQFNSGNSPFDAGTATISGFSTDGTLTGALPDIGPVFGSLPGTVTLDNAGPNDHTEGFTFGSFFAVFVTVDVPSVSGEAVGGSTFALTLFNSQYEPLLLGTSPGGQALLQIDLDAATGEPTVTNASSGGEAIIVATPEPSSLVVTLLGFACMTFTLVRRKARLSVSIRLLRSPFVFEPGRWHIESISRHHSTARRDAS